jgi:hypothetical protein
MLRATPPALIRMAQGVDVPAWIGWLALRVQARCADDQEMRHKLNAPPSEHKLWPIRQP